MTHFASAQFWAAYDTLPDEIRNLADKNFKLLKDDPQHPSLRFKPVGQYWSTRVGRRYRALAVKRDADFIWFWIGSHVEYDRLIGA